MAIDYTGLQALLVLNRSGLLHGKVATLGRHLMHCSRKEIAFLLSEHECTARGSDIPQEPYAEGLFSALGVAEVCSFDVSNYEHPTVVHNFNEPISLQHYESFDVVADFGSLEHIFNAPVALDNLKRMCRIGGILLLVTPTNNFCGHGFYQFSPEFFYRALSDGGDFNVLTICLCVAEDRGKWFDIMDPKITRGRITFLNGKPAYLIVFAQKRAASGAKKFDFVQSDYTDVHSVNGEYRKHGDQLYDPQGGRIKRVLPVSLFNALLKLRRGHASATFAGFQPKSISPGDLILLRPFSNRADDEKTR